MSGFEVRPLGPFDLQPLAALHALCFPEEPWDAAALARLLAMPGACGSLLFAEGAPVGFLLARQAADEAEILTFGVLPLARGAGAGRSLLEAGLARLGELGVRRVFLEVADGNAPARRVYGAAGFRVAGRRRAYYRRAGGAEDALLLLCELPAPGDGTGGGTRAAGEQG